MSAADAEIGARVRELRGSRTQTELAWALSFEGLRFHQQTIQRIETGLRPLRAAELIPVADELGVTAIYLLTGETPTPSETYKSAALAGRVRRLEAALASIRTLTEQELP